MQLQETPIKNAEITAIAFQNWNNKTEYRIRVQVPGQPAVHIKVGQTNYDNLITLNPKQNEQKTAQGGAKTNP